LRQGDYSTAAVYCKKCLNYIGPDGATSPRLAAADLIAAICDLRLGQPVAAQKHFDQGRLLVEEKFKMPLGRGSGFSGYWFDWMFANTLLREAEKAMASQ
jgi:hypothetical protein